MLKNTPTITKRLKKYIMFSKVRIYICKLAYVSMYM